MANVASKLELKASKLLTLILKEELVLKKLELRYAIDPLKAEAEAFNSASVANVASKDELNASKFEILVLTEPLYTLKDPVLTNESEPVPFKNSAFAAFVANEAELAFAACEANEALIA